MGRGSRVVPLPPPTLSGRGAGSSCESSPRGRSGQLKIAVPDCVVDNNPVPDKGVRNTYTRTTLCVLAPVRTAPINTPPLPMLGLLLLFCPAHGGRCRMHCSAWHVEAHPEFRRAWWSAGGAGHVHSHGTSAGGCHCRVRHTGQLCGVALPPPSLAAHCPSLGMRHRRKRPCVWRQASTRPACT